MTESESSTEIAAILGGIEAEHRAWTELIGRLTPDQLHERRGDGWSVIDMVTHMAAWRENATRVARLQAQPDEPYPAPELTPSGILGIDVEAFNRDFMQSHRDWTLEQALEWSEQIHRALLRALEALPPNRVLGGTEPHGARLWYWSPSVIVSRHHRMEVEERFGLPSEGHPSGHAHTG